MSTNGKAMYLALFNRDVATFKQLFQQNPNFNEQVLLWVAGFGDLALFMMDYMSFDLRHLLSNTIPILQSNSKQR